MNHANPAGVSQPLRTLYEVGTFLGSTDGQLMERFVSGLDAGSEAAFAALVERHKAMVLRVCRSVLRDPDDAFQATFLVLARRAGSIRERDSLGPWLYGVALRVAAHCRSDAMRRRARERRAAGRQGGRPEGSDLLGLEAAIHQEIDLLPEKYRAPVVLCYIEGLSHERAAAQLSWPVGTVKTRLNWARGRLRMRLTRRGLAPTACLPGALMAPVVPASLANSALMVALRHAAGCRAASGPVVRLARGGMRALAIRKSGIAATILLAGLAIGAAFGGLGLQLYAQGDDPDARFVAFAPEIERTSNGPSATGRGDPYQAAPGWLWAIAPRPFYGIASPGSLVLNKFIRQLDWSFSAWGQQTKDGSINFQLAHHIGPPGRPIAECRPVVFDARGKRHVPELRRAYVCTDEAGRRIAMTHFHFHLETGQSPFEVIRFIGYERLGPSTPAGDLVEASHHEIVGRRGTVGPVDGFKPGPGYEMLAGPIPIDGDVVANDWALIASGAKGGLICDLTEDKDGSLWLTVTRQASAGAGYAVVMFDGQRRRLMIDSGHDENLGRETDIVQYRFHIPRSRLQPSPHPRAVGLKGDEIAYIGIERSTPASLSEEEAEFLAACPEDVDPLRWIAGHDADVLRKKFGIYESYRGEDTPFLPALYQRLLGVARARIKPSAATGASPTKSPPDPGSER
jgi:RNA polymerase sigma factor (sigma-70 family)